MEQIICLLVLTVWFEHNIHNFINVFADIPNAEISYPIYRYLSIQKTLPSKSPKNDLHKFNPQPKEHKDELHELKVKELLLAQTYKTGYDEKSSELADSYSTTPINILQEKIDSAYKRVKCGYIYNAKMHLLLTSDLLEQKNEAFLRELHNLDDILYNKETVWMISSLMPIYESNMNGLWLLYMYSNTAKSFFQSVYQSNENRINIERNNVKDMHEFTINYLEEFTDTHCEKNNAFNIKYENCTTAVKLREARKNNNFKSFLSVIVANKKELINYIGLNVLKGLSSNFGTEFKHNDLYFQDKFIQKDTVDKLTNIFTNNNDDWKFVYQRLEKIEKEARKLSLNGLKSLGLYQRSIIDLLKGIILNISWKHLLYLDNLINTENFNEKFMDYVALYNKHLTDISELIRIENDNFIKKTIKKFSYLNLINFKANFPIIVNQIKTELDVICKNLQLKANEPSNLDTDICLESFDKIIHFSIDNFDINYNKNQCYSQKIKRSPILDTIFSIDALKGYIRSMFSKSFSFKIIDSFYRMTENLINKQDVSNINFKKIMKECI